MFTISVKIKWINLKSIGECCMIMYSNPLSVPNSVIIECSLCCLLLSPSNHCILLLCYKMLITLFIIFCPVTTVYHFYVKELYVSIITMLVFHLCYPTSPNHNVVLFTLFLNIHINTVNMSIMSAILLCQWWIYIPYLLSYIIHVICNLWQWIKQCK